MRAEGTGPHFEFVTQSKLVSLAHSLIISAFRRLSLTIRKRSFPAFSFEELGAFQGAKWTSVQGLGVFLRIETSEDVK